MTLSPSLFQPGDTVQTELFRYLVTRRDPMPHGIVTAVWNGKSWTDPPFDSSEHELNEHSPGCRSCEWRRHESV